MTGNGRHHDNHVRWGKGIGVAKSQIPRTYIKSRFVVFRFGLANSPTHSPSFSGLLAFLDQAKDSQLG